MSQQVLGRQVSLGDAALAIAQVLEVPPSPATIAALDARDWPMRDPESLRGAALIAESRMSGERPGQLAVDFERLFRGAADRPPIAPVSAPAAAEPGLRRLLTALTGRPGDPDLPGALRALAAASVAGADLPRRHHRCAELVEDHLLTWGARCLTRLQLGARTFCYQGAGALGLGLLRLAAAEH